ncbi:MAG: hypothetical protein WA924_13075 [Burkholderiaceae bacterium]
MTAVADPRPDAPGVLLIQNDVQKGMEAEFNRWYQQQHLAERLAIDGFQVARRYQALGAQPTYMTVYECRSIDVLRSEAYRERLAAPSAWTRKVMPAFRGTLRSACRETWSLGEGAGGTAVVVQCKPVSGREREARRFIAERLGPRLMATDCLVRMALWEADDAVSADCGAEAALRGARDSRVHWVLFIESYDLAQLAPALHRQWLNGEGADNGLLIGSWARYQLMSRRCAS